MYVRQVVLIEIKHQQLSEFVSCDKKTQLTNFFLTTKLQKNTHDSVWLHVTISHPASAARFLNLS